LKKNDKSDFLLLKTISNNWVKSVYFPQGNVAKNFSVKLTEGQKNLYLMSLPAERS